MNRHVSGATDLSDRYTTARVLVSEEMYGSGYQSSGGIELARELLPKLQLVPNDALLEVGCGTGGTLLLAAKELRLKVTGIDRSPDNLELVRQRAVESRVSDHIHLLQGDAAELVPTRRHAGLWCADALMYVADKVTLFANVAKALHSGARGVVLDYGSGNAAAQEEFTGYATSAGYHLPKLLEYAALLEKGGFRCHEVIDYTPRFVGMMQTELERLESGRAEFVAHYDTAQFEHLRERWLRKIRFCNDDQMRAFQFVVERR